MNLSWVDLPGFNYDWGLQGYKPEIRTFGCRAGPESDVSHLIHEVSHGIVCALDDELWRLDYYSYGLTIRQVEVLGQVCVEPLTAQATKLESRVFGIQKAILDDLGVDTNGFYKDAVGALNFMPDWIKFGKRKIKKNRKNVRKSFDWPRQRRLYSVICKRETEAKDHFDDLVEAWNRVCEYNRKALNDQDSSTV